MEALRLATYISSLKTQLHENECIELLSNRISELDNKSSNDTVIWKQIINIGDLNPINRLRLGTKICVRRSTRI